jgi:DNA-binding CsgD family transcriptional regulator
VAVSPTVDVADSERLKADVVLECPGSEPTIRSSVAAARPEGTVVVVGGGRARLDPIAILIKELRVLGSFRYADEFAEVITLLADGALQVADLTSKIASIDVGPARRANGGRRSNRGPRTGLRRTAVGCLAGRRGHGRQPHPRHDCGGRAAWRGNRRDLRSMDGGVLFNGLGQYEAAFVAAQRGVKSWQEPAISTALALVELVTAATRTGRNEVAAEALQRLAVITQASGTDWALGLQARCEALVCDADLAEPHFRAAIDRLSRTRIRGELARAHLLYGEWLRRQNRRNDAREPLRTAHTMFTAMGMNGFADRAAEELGATGETVRKRSHESAGQLTAQETQIVRLVREGLSNQEIAVRLFISRRTVEWHLSKIFAKLEITSRRQLHR